MQNDDVIWHIINHQFCSFKSKVASERTFCQNVYNVSGLCIRSACPLANSRYATIREEDGKCYLYTKTIERAHTPKYMWEKVLLPTDYTEALEKLSAELEHYPKYLVHRNKQRLTKIHQMLIRMRKLKLKARAKIVTTNTKVEQREKGLERKALQAAQIDRAIENELLERLKQSTDNEIYNYPESQYNKALSQATDKYQTVGERVTIETGKAAVDPDEEEYDEAEEEMEADENQNIEYVEDIEESDDEDDIEDVVDSKYSALAMNFYSDRRKPDNVTGKRKLSSNSKPLPQTGNARKARIEIEYEFEDEEVLPPSATKKEVISDSMMTLRNTRMNASSSKKGSKVSNYAANDQDFNF